MKKTKNEWNNEDKRKKNFRIIENLIYNIFYGNGERIAKERGKRKRIRREKKERKRYQ